MPLFSKLSIKLSTVAKKATFREKNMYDDLVIRLGKYDFEKVDFLGETSQYFDVSRECIYDGDVVLHGKLEKGIKVELSERGIKLSGSLCKFHLGDNFQTLHRSDTKRAIERLSDTFHLPIGEGKVTRIDIAQNFILKQDLQEYYNHFGELKDGNKRSSRVPITTENGLISGLYYYQSNGLLVFYDKVKEQTEKRQPIPEMYQNRNVLRYEQRYTGRLPKAFNVERVTASILYDEQFYINIIDRWKSNYFKINKINDITINLTAMKGIRDFNRMGILCMLEMFGGELALKEQVKEAQKMGNLSKDAAFDIRKAIDSACKEKIGITDRNDCISELDKKIKEAVKFYR